MRLSIAILAAAISFVSAAIPLEAGDIPVNSDLGRKLMAKARRVEDVERRVANNNNNNNNAQNVATWLAGFSIKFQGCFSIQQWNTANGGYNNDVKIETKNLARFRLCPSSSCSASKAAGCNSGYGDYIVDMDYFIYEYYYAELMANEYKCNTALANCNCANGDTSCSASCFAADGLSQCSQWERDLNFGVLGYLQCAEYKFQNGNGNNYYLGPYCASQGGSIYLGLFSDNTCTTPADSNNGLTTYSELAAGVELPYNKTSLASATCLSCVKESDKNEQDNVDQNSNNNVLDMCNEIYQKAGKCESNLPSGTVSTPNDAACQYMQGVKIARADGVITTSGHRPNPVVTAFIVIFAMAFAAMGFYVWYLRTRLGVKRTRLL